MTIPENALADIHDRASLFAFLNDTLNWPTDREDPFTYNGPTLDGDRCPDMRISQIVPFTAGDPFAVMLVESEGALKRSHLREILRRIREEVRNQAKFGGREMQEFLFLCAEDDFRAIRFARFTPKEKGAPKLSVFGWTKDTLGETRTVREHSLPALRIQENLIGEIDWTACNWDAAWDVEKVTKEFFSEYLALFNRAEVMMNGLVSDANLFTTRLFNRLLFIHFLSKKGWLRYQGNTDYLRELWDHRDTSANFYMTHLVNLFFSGLNNPQARDIMRDNPVLLRLIGEVPFLNGGLFHREQDETPSPEAPDEICESIIHLFGRYNFTVMESTPDDEDVAVDPEMLGKLFEKVVTGRHENGSYYTPRSVVQFMCREALKGYLGGCEKLVDEHDASDVSVPEARKLLEKLSALKVVDPACGSGAYLLGMLHELHTLHHLLDTRAGEATARDDYQRKLSIIQNNIYGVDLQDFAVQTARLRLWLSLAVEYAGDIPEPLPNLDFKIECGDSLISPLPENGFEADLIRQAQIKEYEEAKWSYANPYNLDDRTTLYKMIMEIRSEIRNWLHSKDTFDWRVDFTEVFENNGFDIVIANPPYVRADEQFNSLRNDETARQKAISGWKNYRYLLKQSKMYETLYEKWDLYIPFLERAYKLLKENGHMVFIIPDAYNANKYAEKSHEFFLEKSSIIRIDFCTDVDLFDAGVANTILHFQKKCPKPDHTPMRVRRFAPNREEFESYSEYLSVNSQNIYGKSLFRCDTELKSHIYDGMILLSNIFYVSVGLVIHADEDGHQGEFTTDDVLSTQQDKNHPYGFVFGKDIIRWSYKNIRYLEWGTKRAPEHFRRITFSELHSTKEKILAVRTPGAIPKCVYDNNQIHFDASVVGFIPWHYLKDIRNKSIYKTAKYSSEMSTSEKQIHISREDMEAISNSFIIKYLLAIMNSKYVKEWLSHQRRHKLHVYPNDWKQLPIPRATPEEQAEIAALAQKCLDARGVGCEAWEAEIDAKVERLYFG